LFRDRDGLRCSAGKIAPGVDVRATGGYAVWWGPDPGADLISQLAPWPEWLVPPPEIIPAIPREITHIGNYAHAALQNEISRLAGTASGSRNHALNRTTFCLFQLVGAGKLDRAETEARLIHACQANGLIADDGLASVRQTIRSASNAGLRNPRRVA
jgi:hypothetical protein